MLACRGESVYRDICTQRINQDLILEFMAARGVETSLVEHDNRGGKEWEGFRYFIRE